MTRWCGSDAVQLIVVAVADVDVDKVDGDKGRLCRPVATGKSGTKGNRLHPITRC